MVLCIALSFDISRKSQETLQGHILNTNLYIKLIQKKLKCDKLKLQYSVLIYKKTTTSTNLQTSNLRNFLQSRQFGIDSSYCHVVRHCGIPTCIC